jgi:hypothetical protein
LILCEKIPFVTISFLRCEDTGSLVVKVELPLLSPDPESSATEELPELDSSALKEEELKEACELEAPRYLCGN